MPSKAWKAFDSNAEDVKRLLEIHKTIGGDEPGRRYRLEVLNKSAIVLITAIWEAYCEDLAAEALDHLVTHVPSASLLPKELKKRIAKEIKADLNEIAVWDLADGGWKVLVKARLESMAEERNRRLNTPKSESIDQHFADVIGLESISDSWAWEGMSTTKARLKLDQYVTLRGAIAHRGKGSATCKKSQVEDYFDHIRRLVRRTGGRVNAFVYRITGHTLWPLRKAS